MIIRHGAASNVGLVRRQNEDSYVAGDGVFAVCDGMGGALAGEVASETACRAIMELAPGTSPAELQAAVSRANEEILSRGLSQPSLSGMGTTLTAAVRRGDGLVFAHVGDSRAYLLRGGDFAQLTEDHSLVAELVRQGRLTPEEAAVHPHRSVITRALGTEPGLEADILELGLKSGDRLVLCSDGLTGRVEDGRVAEILGAGQDPQATADQLVDEALANGGDDNVTVLVLFVEEGEEPQGGGHRSGVFGPARRQRSGGAARSNEWLLNMRAWLRRRRRLVISVGVVLLVVLIAVAGVAIFVSGVYFVGTYGDSVALYQGVPETVVGIQLFTLIEVGRTSYSQLEPYVKARVDAHELTNKEEGQKFLRSLESAL